MTPSGSDPSDGELVARVRSGDRAAAQTLLERHYDSVRSICRRITGSPDDAADATQNAMIAILSGLDRFDGRSALTTWIHRVAVNAALDEIRRRQRRPRPGLPETPAGGGVRTDSSATPSFEQGLVDRNALDSALRTLPEEYRVTLVLRDVAQMDYATIAATLGVPVGTVRSRLARARGLMVERLRGNFSGSSDVEQPSS